MPDVKAVFVFGAGMEMGGDIGLCSSRNLPASILNYMDTYKSTVDVLKKKVKTESFKTLVQKRINNLFQNNEKLSELIEGLNKEYSSNNFVVLLSYIHSEIEKFTPPRNSSEKSESCKEENDKKEKQGENEKTQEQAESTYNTLKESYRSLPDVAPDFLIDVEKLAFSHNWTKIITGFVDVYTDVVAISGKDSDDAKCLSEILGCVVDYDSLLTESYIGFYTKKQTLKNRYIYLSWLLWSYLASIDRKKNVDDTIYSKVAGGCIYEGDSVITLNYSTFVDRALEKNGKTKCIHFHGDLAHCINVRDEELILGYYDFSKETCDILTGLKEDIIPSMMPPLDIKPLISNAYLGRWLEAKNAIDEATQIFVVGYSFSHSDDHFNELLYNAGDKRGKEIYIVCPEFKNENKLKGRFKGYTKVETITCEAGKFFEYK